MDEAWEGTAFGVTLGYMNIPVFELSQKFILMLPKRSHNSIFFHL